MAKMSNRGPTKRFLISEMDRSVKRMLKLIEEEGDNSFAKKAEIYIQKRPELISQVENFYRMFKSLAERYDDITFDPRSQPYGINGICSAPPSAITSPEHRLSRRLSGTHAVFLDVHANKGYETSTYDSSSDADDSLCNANHSGSSNYGNYRRLRRQITELENELRKIQIEQEVNKSNSEVADYEEELRIAKEKIRVSEEEISELKARLDHYELLHDDGINKELVEDNHGSKVEMEQLKMERNENAIKLSEIEEEMRLKDDQIDELKARLDHYELLHEDDGINKELVEDNHGSKVEMEQLKVERDEYAIKLSEIEEEMRLKDEQIDELNNRLQKVKMECKESSKSVEELEKVVQKQRVMIEEAAEEKVQTERQLCISLEHYRNAYQMLRKGLLEQKNAVMAS